jgi:hypothetical protein
MQTVHQSREQVKSELIQIFASMIDPLLQRVDDDSATNRCLEEETWNVVLEIGATTLGVLLGSRAQVIAEQEIKQRGLSPSQVHRRLDKDYWATVTTTLGTVTFPWHAYRQMLKNGASITRNPAQQVLFPAFKTCRSSGMCLEWETRLGSDHPFRTAQEALTYFTHGAVRLEDTTIARHLVRIGQLVTRDDMYRTPEQIRQILVDQATCDRETARPLLYASSDAHALRRYVDDTWAAKWKMSNGIRLWCEDTKTGQVIHIGGEFTWGDCNEVHAIFKDLIARGILPSDGDYGDGVQAQLVWLSDGMPWFKDHILPLFSDVVVILDVYHLLQAFATLIALCYKPKSKKARRWLDRAAKLTVGPVPATAKKSTTAKMRRGHKKGTGSRTHHAHQRPVDPKTDPAKQAADLIAMIFEVPTPTKKAEAAQHRLFMFLYGDPDRINYVAFRYRGYQIGSGAMESVHRTGSQIRLKLPGAKWLPYTSQAVFNIRMMRLAGNSNRFWAHPDLEMRLAAVKLPI